jgi:glucose-1-phosphatase
MHKAILFDLGKVLVPFDFKLGYQALEKCCPHNVDEIRRRIKLTGLVTPFEKGLIEPAEFVARLSAALDLDLDYEGFRQAWCCIFYGQNVPDEMLQHLAERYRLSLLSNTNILHFQLIQARYPMLRYFHDCVLSYEVHAMKPEPEIFQAAIARAGCRPEECFFTDDLAENVEAARHEGIDAVQFESLVQIRREMEIRGIRCN